MSSLSYSTYAQPFGALTAVAAWPAVIFSTPICCAADFNRRYHSDNTCPAMPVVTIPSVDYASYEMPAATTPAAASPAQAPHRELGGAGRRTASRPDGAGPVLPAFIPQPGYGLAGSALPEITAPAVTYDDSATTAGENAPSRFFDPAAIWAPAAAAENVTAAGVAWWQEPQAAILDAGDPLWGAVDAPAKAVAESPSAWWQDPQAAILDVSDPLWGDVAAAPDVAAAAEPASAWWQDPQTAILDTSDPLWGDAAAVPEMAAAPAPATAWWQDPQAFTLQLDGAQAIAAAGTPGSFDHHRDLRRQRCGFWRLYVAYHVDDGELDPADCHAG